MGRGTVGPLRQHTRQKLSQIALKQKNINTNDARPWHTENDMPISD